MQFKDCPRCKGIKEIIGLGMMLKECPECRGKGYLEVPVVIKKKKKKIERPASETVLHVVPNTVTKDL